MTVKELLARLEKHESECGIHLKEINRRLASGSEKFKFQQNTIWGLYVLIIASGIISKFF